MAYSETLAHSTVAISVSDSPDLAPLGMNASHLRDATAELARHLLALGARIAYGGDLRQHGFTEILFELVSRHRRDADEGDERTAVLSYLAWPVHISRPFLDLKHYREDLTGLASLLLLDQQGMPLPDHVRRGLFEHQPAEEEWSIGLTNMRRAMSAQTTARIVAGGAVAGYKGVMPGIAEEALLALEQRKPLYLLGGFGGCAADIAATMGVFEPRGIPDRSWVGRERFIGRPIAQFNNGLEPDEIRTLARTPHIDEAITLVLRGLNRLLRAV